jgi:hypothetical protein
MGNSALGVCVLVVVVVVLILLARRRKSTPLGRSAGPKTVKIHNINHSAIPALRQNLRVKVGWDDSKIDRLIDLERERMPNASLQTLMESAIERWERDNR